MSTQLLNQASRDRVFRCVRDAVADYLGDHVSEDGRGLAGRCLEWAWQGYCILRDWPGAPRTIIQAGSAAWPRIAPHQDDGGANTHMAYVWDPDATADIKLRPLPSGEFVVSLPEIHVWLACPDTDELIDFSTGEWPAACQVTLGLDWPGKPPPPYFWSRIKDRPEGVGYAPYTSAIECIMTILRLEGRR